MTLEKISNMILLVAAVVLFAIIFSPHTERVGHASAREITPSSARMNMTSTMLLRLNAEGAMMGQAVSQATAGLPAPVLYGSSLPSSLYVCNAAFDGIPYWQTGANSFWFCSNGGWVQPIVGVPYYLNGTLQQALRCDIVTSTSAANGTGTINISGMGFTSISGVPQPAVQSSGTTLAAITMTATSVTSVSVIVQTSATLSVVGINVTLFSNAALPYSVTVCGV